MVGKMTRYSYRMNGICSVTGKDVKNEEKEKERHEEEGRVRHAASCYHSPQPA